jgi:hypothetical protein
VGATVVRRIFTLWVALVSGLVGIPTYAAPGELDSGFGTGGRVTTSFGGQFSDMAASVVLQDDGKIVAVDRAARDFSRVALEQVQPIAARPR